MEVSFSGRLRFLLLAIAAAVLLLVLGSAVEWTQLRGAFASARPAPLFAAFVLTLFFPVLNTLRWLAVLRAAGIAPPFARCFQLTMAAWPLGTVTPAKSGEFVKGLAVRSRTLGLGSVLTERVLDVFVLGLFGVVAGLWWGHGLAAAGGVMGLVLALGFLLGAPLAASLLGEGKLRTRIEAFLSVSPRLLARPRLLTSCLLASSLNWFLSMAQLWYLLAAFGDPAPLGLIVAIIPAATFVGLLPVTLAGAGTRDAALLVLAGTAILPASLLAASIVYTFLGYFLLGALGLPFLRALTGASTRGDTSP